MTTLPLTAGATDADAYKEMPAGSIQQGGKFINSELVYSMNMSSMVSGTKAYITTKRMAASPERDLPIRPITAKKLADRSKPVLYRLGHSSVLIGLDGEFVLTDPVFSDRASPVQWAGPKRFHPTPISIEQLPPIKAVVISHDHYDHLDKAAIMALANNVEYFLTPLGVGEHLRNWGVADSKIRELDWWQDVRIGSINFTATPAQHFSGRGLLDKDKTLWASWVIKGEQANLFFSGDSGYFNGFKEIGERFGPFDVTMIETGAYNENWSEIHMMPEQSLQAHLDLRGKAMLPIHNTTFDLALHDWYEPLDVVHELAQQHQVQVITPIIGEQISVKAPAASVAWWREYAPVAENQLAAQ